MENDYRLIIRVPREWHKRVKAEAALNGVSLSEFVRAAVDDWLEKNKRTEEGKQDG